MSIVSRLHSQRKLNGVQAMVEAIGFTKPLIESKEKLYANYSAAYDRLLQLGMAIQLILSRDHSKPFKPPKLRLVRAGALTFQELFEDMNIAVFEGCQELTNRLREAGFGNIEWYDEDTCTFDYPVSAFTYGLTSKTVDRYKATHDLVKARQHKLPALDIKRPKAVDKLIAGLPAFVHPHLRIVTGLEVVKTWDHVGTENGLNDFGKFLQGAKDEAAAMAKSAKVRTAAAVAGLAAVGAAIGSFMATAGPIAAQVAIADPAVVLGNVVFCGWENQ